MYQLFETLLIKDGKLQNAEYHLQRMNRSRFELGITGPELINLAPIKLDDYLAKGFSYRCRIDYSTVVQAISFSKHIKTPIKKLKVVNVNQLNYAYKFADRTQLDYYRKQWPDFDDVLFVLNSQITDTSIGNIVFWDGTNYITPKNPLLQGTQRSYLLENKIINEEVVLLDDLKKCISWSIINALRPLQLNEFNPIGQIYI